MIGGEAAFWKLARSMPGTTYRFQSISLEAIC
jgi:hypothetical protein